ncbi:hypothetical protein I551_3509 [Mycobacterium ulcerans str. Harvey]|uniref:Uncharacterized protein n=1 Tax=Mycobacterium ulcerans str. Harvey TaxID=1299332 RepID=A0ABP3AH32_MYCUL|nr:hypothetical protein MMSP_3151 [Mycobacterium sp. 012931]EUA90021.1 hypothetical protein I551_3509 [Mycobacterium ulcerans str. Harvey]
MHLRRCSHPNSRRHARTPAPGATSRTRLTWKDSTKSKPVMHSLLPARRTNMRPQASGAWRAAIRDATPQ